jgi:tight adherence protein C
LIDGALITSILIFVGLMLLSQSIYSLISYRDRRRNLIGKIKGNPQGSRVVESVPADDTKDGFLRRSTIGVISSLGRRMRSAEEREPTHMRKILWQAGYRRRNALSIFLGSKILMIILMIAGFSTMRLFIIRTIPTEQLIAIYIVAAVVGFYLPDIWIRIKLIKRRAKFMDGFPDAIDLMVVCVDAGMGLDAAIQRVGEEMEMGNKVVNEEFRLVGLELRAGKQRRDALRNLADRAGSEDVSSLVTLLIETDRFGTSVAQALRVHSESIRTKRHQRAEELAAKLPVKLIFPLIFFILPALMVTILGPAAIRIYRIILKSY